MGAPFKHGGHQVAATRVSAMPKRLNASLSRVPAAGVDPFESIEPRRRRLLPQSDQPAPPPLPGSSSAEHAGREPVPARSSHTVERIPNRADAPVLHTSRRGSRAKAAAAIQDADPESLVQELIVDRHAASGVANAASLLRGVAALPPPGPPSLGGATTDVSGDSGLHNQSRLAVQARRLQLLP
jgi:hypothetical protein